MKRLLIAAPLLAAFAFFAPTIADEAAPTRTARDTSTHELLHATLYTQSAAEYRALCLASYAQGRMQLEKALADKTWTAATEQSGSFADLPPAVILDADETALDNSAYEARLIEGNSEYGAA